MAEDKTGGPADPDSEREFIQVAYHRMQRASAGLPVARSRKKKRLGRNEKSGSSPQDGAWEEGWQPGPGIARGKRGAGRSYYDPQSLGDVLDAIEKKPVWQESLSLGSIAARWDQIVGPQVAEHCKIESFDDGKLQVRTDSTAWAHQLRLLLPQIEKRVAEELGEGAVRQVIVHAPKPPSWGRGRFRVQGRGPRDTYG